MSQTKNVPRRPSLKKTILSELFAYCDKHRKYTFDNDLVKKLCRKHNFKNPFDVTKVDNLSILPEDIKNKGYCIIHIGQGEHRFVQAVNDCFHDFEDIENPEIPWRYRKSALNEIDTSESNILSVGFNQRIIHDFLYEDIVASPKMYGAKRTREDLSYTIGKIKVNTTKLQMEIDLTTEYHGVVTVFEGKNNFPQNFSVYQLFHPFLHYQNLKKKKKIAIKEVNCCYLLRKIHGNESIVRLYLYTFTDANDMSSISLRKCDEYRLIQR